MERAAIAREIHDDIGGSLAAIRLDLSWIGRHSPSEEMTGHVTTANDMLQHAIGASQRIMMNLRPAILDQGLHPAIQWLAESFQRRSGVKTSLLGNQPVIANNLNIPKPEAGQPTLMTFDEVTTMFHEFGHALHGLFASQKYPSLSGTNTARDWVEFPSQFHENFATIPAAFASTYPTLNALNIMHLATPESAILSAVIFNALIIIALIPLALKGVAYRAIGAGALLRRNLLVYGLGGIIIPFIGIKAIDLAVSALGLA